MNKTFVNGKQAVGVIVLDDSRPSNDTLTRVIDEIINALSPRNRKVVEEAKIDLLRINSKKQ